MAITRRGESSLALRWEIVRKAKSDERRREFVWLLAASIAVLMGLALVYLTKTQDFGEQKAQLRSGHLVNLNTLSDASSVESLLASVAPLGAESSKASSRVLQFIDRNRPLSNVGALARLRANIAVGQVSIKTGGKLEGVGRSAPLLPLSRMKPLTVVRTPEQFNAAYLHWAALYFCAFWTVHLAWRWRKFRGDPAILPALQLLTGIGVILMVSLRDPLRDTLEFRKFIIGIACGCALLLLPLLRAFQYRNFAKLTYLPLFGALGLFFALLLFGSGPSGSDARVNLGPIQPAELIKLLLVLFLAGYFARNWEKLRDLRERRMIPQWLQWLGLPRVGDALPVMYGVTCALVMFFALKDMGPALVTGMLFLILFAIARRRSGMALLGIGLLVAGVSVGYHFGIPHTVADRVSMWLSPWNNGVHGGDQLAHSLWAFATGGPWGSGPGLGDPSVIPAGHTDLVLPAIAEEWGFPGVLSIALLFALLTVRSLRIALRAPDEYGMFLATGLGTLIALEMLLISGGALGAIPLSGVVSPFLSSGNTAMLTNFLIFAVLLGISNQSAVAAFLVEDPKQESDRLEPVFGRPVQVLAALLGCCALALLGRSFFLEVWHDNDLISRDTLVYASDGVKRAQHNPRINLLAAAIPRGNIYDRNGVLLATSRLADLERDRARYQDLGVDTTGFEHHPQSRYYPFGPATVHLLGDWNTGQQFHASNASLVEHDSNKKLQGYADRLDLAAIVRYRHQPDNQAIQALFARDRDVHTTIDIRLQLKALVVMATHLGGASPKKGAAVMMDVTTGDVLALVDWPQPSPVDPSDDELLDRARYGEYPPGSTFKLVTAMAALERDPNAANLSYSCKRLSDGRAGVEIKGWRRPIRDDIGDRVHGTIKMGQAIAVSCNAYFAQLGVFAVGSKALFETAQRLGINPGSERDLKQMLPFAAYGQGPVVTTPLQMARVAATIAGEGEMPQGRWVLDGSDGRNADSRQIISREASQFLATSMRSVVTEGTARVAFAGSKMLVAGKTGTAQLNKGQPDSWFAGFAPADAPVNRRVAIAVVIEHGGYGAQVAAPIARELLEAAAQLGAIPGGAEVKR